MHGSILAADNRYTEIAKRGYVYMHFIKVITFAAAIGFFYQFIVTLLGTQVARMFWPSESETDVSWQQLSGLAFGIIVHAVVTGCVLMVAPSLIKYVMWVLAAVALLDFRGTARCIASSWRALFLAATYGFVCYAIMVGFQLGVARGDNLLWTIYRLTNVTPGDSPQGLLQAQYLLHGTSLTNLENFSIFDRPFLGGLVSLEVLSAVGRPPEMLFNQFPVGQTFAYIAVWIWLNAGFTYAVMALARRYYTGPRALFCVLVLTAPIVVFNTIGAWPKLLATYITCCAGLLMLERRWFLGILLAGFGFYTHGSFLWPHLAMSGAAILYVLLSSGRQQHRRLKALGMILLAIAFPAAWFLAQHIVASAASPLQNYYLYGVTPYYSLTHTLDQVASRFYSSTTPVNLAVLPFANLAKCLVPYEFLKWFVSFSYASPGITLRALGDSLFDTQFNRPLFSFCLTAGVIAAMGIRRDAARRWPLTLAIVTLFLLPLVPGMGLYRRDDHFINATMMFSILPVIMALAAGLEALSRRGAVVILTMAFGEYALVYWSRYPSIRYETFYEYYLWAVGTVLAAGYLAALRCVFYGKDRAGHA